MKLALSVKIVLLTKQETEGIAFQIDFRALALSSLEAINKEFCMFTYMFMCVCWEQKITPGHLRNNIIPAPLLRHGLSWAYRLPSRPCRLRFPVGSARLCWLCCWSTGRLCWLPVSPRRLPVIASQHWDHKCAIVFCLFTWNLGLNSGLHALQNKPFY